MEESPAPVPKWRPGIFSLHLKQLEQCPAQVMSGPDIDWEQGAPCRKEVGPGLRTDQKKPESGIFHGF